MTLEELMERLNALAPETSARSARVVVGLDGDVDDVVYDHGEVRIIVDGDVDGDIDDNEDGGPDAKEEGELDDDD